VEQISETFVKEVQSMDAGQSGNANIAFTTPVFILVFVFSYISGLVFFIPYFIYITGELTFAFSFYSFYFLLPRPSGQVDQSLHFSCEILKLLPRPY